MFGLERRYYRKHFTLLQRNRADVLLDHVDRQLSKFRESLPAAGSLEADIYLHDYLLGILDSLTRHFESEARKRFGVCLHRDFFVDYLVMRFGCSIPVARHYFEAARRRYTSQLFVAGKFNGAGHGYSDGLAIMSQRTSQARLLRYLTERIHASEAPPPMPAILEYAAND